MGHYSATHNKFGSDGTTPGKSITTVDLDCATSPYAGTKCIKIVKDSSETYGGVWLTKNIDFGDFSSMTAGKSGGSYTGAILSGATSLTFYAKAAASTNVRFGFGIDTGTADTSDSDSDYTDVTLGTTWTKYTITTSDDNMSHINGVFYAKVTSSTGTIYIDAIHYNPRVFGYNDEAVEARGPFTRRKTITRASGPGGWVSRAFQSLHRPQMHREPAVRLLLHQGHEGRRRVMGRHLVQQLGADPSEAVRWSYGTGVGANLTGATKLTFYAKTDTAGT